MKSVWTTLRKLGMIWLAGISIAATAALGVRQSRAQAPAVKMEFDVASVRQNKSGLPGSGGDKVEANVPLGASNLYAPTGGVFTATNYQAITFIIFAYKVNPSQYAVLEKSLPNWVKTDR